MRIGLYIFVFLTIYSCGSYNSDTSVKKVFRYNEAAGLTSLDPAFAKDQSIIWPCLNLYNGLVQLDTALRIVPAIAHSWEISGNGKIYTFHLRKDVFFHSNASFLTPDSTRRVIANDFVYSFHRLTDTKLSSPGAWVMKPVLHDEKGNIKGIYSKNDTTLIIELENVYPPFLGLLTMPYCSVVPKEIVENYGKDFRSNPCGTGPFQFSYWKEGVKLILLKNENYFEFDGNNRLPFLDALEISFLSDKQSAFIEFLKGRLDFLSGADPAYKDELLTRSGHLQPKYGDRFIMETQPYLNTEYLGILMDNDNPTMLPLTIKKIRQALNYGFDRRKMISYLRNNMGTPGIYGIVPPGLPSFDSSLVAYEFDPEKVKQLLIESGFPNGQNFPEIILSTTTNYQDLCEFIKSQWEEFGFKIKIDINQAAVHRKMIAEQKLGFFRGSWIADYPDAENYLSLFYSPNFAPVGPNYTHFKNKRFDQLYESAASEINDSVRYQYYREMDKIIIDESPVIILFYDKVLRLYDKNISGLGTNAMNLLILKNVRKN